MNCIIMMFFFMHVHKRNVVLQHISCNDYNDILNGIEYLRTFFFDIFY